ncbi:uncharacterized protein Tco025E_01282, partial [Trypanosoma conorhini]
KLDAAEVAMNDMAVPEEAEELPTAVTELEEEAATALPKKKGRSRKLDVAEVAMNDMAVPEEAEELPTAVTELEEAAATALPKKKGRSRKLDAAALKKGGSGKKQKLSKKALREAKKRAKEEKRKQAMKKKGQVDENVMEAMNAEATSLEEVAKGARSAGCTACKYTVSLRVGGGGGE